MNQQLSWNDRPRFARPHRSVAAQTPISGQCTFGPIDELSKLIVNVCL